MRRLVLLILSVVAVTALTAPLAEGKVRKDFVGVQDDYLLAADANYRTANFSAMSAIGVGTVRQAFLWREIETAPGQYDFSTYDEYVSKASAHGLKILAVVFGPPQFRMKRGPAKFTCQPRSTKEFGEYAAELARRYGSNGTFWSENPSVPRNPITTWQIWNEPNLPQYWCGKPNARQYVSLLKAAHKALNQVDRKSETVTAGIPQSRIGTKLTTFLSQMYRARAAKYFDTLAIHPYGKTVPELGRRLRSIRRIMNKRRDRRTKLWVTELAWSDVGPGSPFRVGKNGQANRIKDAYRLIGKQRRRLNLRGAIYVYWRDLPPYPPRFTDFWGLHTGLLRKDGSPKRSFFRFKQAISRLK